MKQIILFGCALILSLSVKAQTVEITQVGQTAVLNGTTVNFTTSNAGDNNIELHFKNTSNTDQYWKLTRVELTAPASWEDYVCWGIEGEIGTCYNQSAQNPWVTPDPLQVYDANFNPVSGLPVNDNGLGSIHWNVNAPGTGHYRYYVHVEGGPYIDSVDVNVVYSLLSIKENTTVKFDVYPNPVSSDLQINAVGVENYDVKIVDVLGKVILQESASNTKKIDVSNFKNGVYLVTISDKSGVLQTKRIVVRH